MTGEEIIRVKKKIEAKKVQRIKAQTTIENIQKEWKEKYSINTVDEAETKIEQLNEDIKTTEKQIDRVSTKLEELTDWED